MTKGINFEKMSRPENKKRIYVENRVKDYDIDGPLFCEELTSDIDTKHKENFNYKKIEGYFDPEKELSNILKLKPGREKDEALIKFKLELAEQQKGFAFLKQRIFEEINKNNENESLDFLLNDIVDEYREKYKFSPYQIEFVKNMINEFIKKNREVNRFYYKHKGDPEKIYQDIYNIKPRGRVEVVKGPISLSFILSDLVDYTRLHNSDFSGRPNINIKNSEIEKANKSGGVFTSIPPHNNPDLEGTIIGVKNNNIFVNEILPTIITHEEQHAINQIYLNNLEIIEKKYFETSLHSCSDFQIAKKIISTYCNNLIDKYSNSVKDEILAYKIDGFSDNDSLVSKLITNKFDGGIYDYFNRDATLNNICNYIYNFSDTEKGILAGDAKYILTDKYKELIKNGISAFDVLRNKNYSNQSITAILMQYNLRQWLKVSERMPFVSLDDFDNSSN